MTLEDWENNRWLIRQQTSAKEIENLLRIVQRDLKDAVVCEISAETRLQTAFNAALTCATIALRASGYKLPVAEGHHKKTIDSLKFTLGVDSSLIKILNDFRKKRSEITYDLADSTSESEVDYLLKLVNGLFDQLMNWLKANHPQLIK